MDIDFKDGLFYFYYIGLLLESFKVDVELNEVYNDFSIYVIFKFLNMWSILKNMLVIWFVYY